MSGSEVRTSPQGDLINNPAHYGGKADVYETIKVMRAKLTNEEFVGAMKFQVGKYLDRSNKKGALQDDLLKAQYYMNALVEHVIHDRNYSPPPIKK